MCLSIFWISINVFCTFPQVGYNSSLGSIARRRCKIDVPWGNLRYTEAFIITTIIGTFTSDIQKRNAIFFLFLACYKLNSRTQFKSAPNNKSFNGFNSNKMKILLFEMQCWWKTDGSKKFCKNRTLPHPRKKIIRIDGTTLLVLTWDFFEKNGMCYSEICKFLQSYYVFKEMSC